MRVYQAKVQVWLKPSVFDPQGHAVEKALDSLGHSGIQNVRIGKYMELQVEASSKEEAEQKVQTICDEVLCNPVMETYAYTVQEGLGI